MSRYIDKDAIDYDFYWNTKGYSIQECQRAEQLVNEQPTADVVEVVRCRDCEFWQDDWLTSHDGYHYCSMVDLITDGDFYCNYAERKILPKD